MVPSKALADWQVFAVLADAMLAAAERADWDEAIRLGGELQQAQQSLPDVTILPTDQQASLRPLLEHANVVIRIISTQLAQQRDALGALFQQTRNEDRLRSAYGE